MTEHNIEELKRQRDAAQGRVREAEKAFSEAHNRLCAALIAKAEADFAARGIVKGSPVRLGGYRGIYVGHEAERHCIGARATVMAAKKDGTPHATHTARGFGWGSDSKIEIDTEASK